MTTGRLIVVGGGRMGEALCAGLLVGGMRADDLTVVERHVARRDELSAGLAARHPGFAVVDGLAGLDADADAGAVVAVKPADVEAVCAELAGSAVPIVQLETWLDRPSGAPAVLRAMPNTPAVLGAAASALSPGASSGPDDLSWAAGVLGSVGTVVTVAEPLLDAVTGLSGSGPAYVFLLAEALVDAGVLVGLPRVTAQALTRQVLLGSARMLAETGEPAEQLRASVTSPGGTTAAGLRVLETAALRGAVLDAVAAATERSRQLGGQ